MKVKIGVGTPVDCASVEIDGPVLKAFGAAAKGKVLRGQLLLAYHLHPGETVRASEQAMAIDGEVVYEVTQ